MSLKRILTALLPVLILPLSTFGQTEQPGVLVRTLPPGAEVRLDGEALVSGISPAFFPHGLVGSYKLQIEKYGYERHTTEVVLDPTRLITVDITLSPKTRLKAAARTIVIPGWGQAYAGNKAKGYIFGTLAAGALATYLWAENDFQNKKDKYNERVAEWDSTVAAGSIDDLRRLEFFVQDAQNQAYDAENIRRGTIGAVIGVWGLALLDVVFFFPEERATFDVKGISIEPSIEPTQFGLSLSKRF